MLNALAVNEYTDTVFISPALSYNYFLYEFKSVNILFRNCFFALTVKHFVASIASVRYFKNILFQHTSF